MKRLPLSFVVAVLALFVFPAHASFPVPPAQSLYKASNTYTTSPWTFTDPASAAASLLTDFQTKYNGAACSSLYWVFSATNSTTAPHPFGATQPVVYVCNGGGRTGLVTAQTPEPSCPANSTQSGSLCTCAPNFNEVNGACIAKQVCDWAKDMQVAGGSFMIETGKNFCHSGCTFTLAPDAGSSPFRARQDGKWYEQRYQGDFKGTGTGATNCGVGDVEEEPAIDPPEDKPEAPAQPCPAGQTAGAQIIAPGGGGGYACMTPEETEAKQKKTVETTNPDGSTSTTTTEQTTICGQDSCNTTTNTSVSGGGTTQTTTETTSTSKDAFCKSNPSDKNCTGSAGGMSPGSPGAQGAPAVPGLYEQKYPDGIAGVWTAKKNALLATPLGQLTTQLMPNIPAGGSLPVWNLNLDLGDSWNFGTYDVAPSAQVWEWAGVFIIIGALLLARALIFGG